MSERRLVSIRRSVPAGRAPEYAAAWARLREAAAARGAHAWVFRAEADADARLEFIEFRPGADPRGAPAVAEALLALERLAAASVVEEWVGG